MIRVVHEDDDLLAVDKPEGVSCQAADPEHPDDLPHRLQHERGLDYIGVHQRLDRDTSGVIVYAKRKEANPGLAAQMEGRQVDKRYVAVVTGWRGGPRRLEHFLAKGKDGEMVCSQPKDRRAKRAVTRVENVEREGDRARLSLRIETGRTHQIRAQLAAVGAPVCGDVRYGGEPAPRLMLHAERLRLRHPTTDAALDLVAPPPPLFDAWLRGGFDPFAPGVVGEMLEAAAERRWGLAARPDLTAHRVLDADGDGVPGVTVDRYGEWLVVSLYDEGVAHERAVLEAVAGLGARGVYVKRRPRQANVLVEAGEDHAPAAPVIGAPAPSPLGIVELGVPLLVRLGDGMSTGLFLDQRLNRARVRAIAGGARVLNLFCYTAGFSVAAALGGARETLSIDASAPALEWARENFEHAGLSPEAHRLERADCFEALKDLVARNERFDLVILDPPTYSRTRTTRWTSGKGWRRLARLALEVLAPGGRLLACSNDRRMPQHEFRRHVRAAARGGSIELRQLKDLPLPPDFRAPFGPKSLLGTRG
ncbi:MAG: class I SAM-dependent methyltransferase [Myxococcales bacterium]|nr:class I SAM-dependent methyltransferase [Myxococcales bacterium]